MRALRGVGSPVDRAEGESAAVDVEERGVRAFAARRVHAEDDLAALHRDARSRRQQRHRRPPRSSPDACSSSAAPITSRCSGSERPASRSPSCLLPVEELTYFGRESHRAPTDSSETGSSVRTRNSPSSPSRIGNRVGQLADEVAIAGAAKADEAPVAGLDLDDLAGVERADRTVRIGDRMCARHVRAVESFENANVPVAPAPTEPLPPGGRVIFLEAREEEVARVRRRGRAAGTRPGRSRPARSAAGSTSQWTKSAERAWAMTPAPSGEPSGDRAVIRT